MRQVVIGFFKVAGAYLAAAVGCLLYLQWPHYEGHAHVPFSSFPDFLVWSPIAPYFLLAEFGSNPGGAILAAVIFLAIFLLALGILFGTLRLNRAAST